MTTTTTARHRGDTRTGPDDDQRAGGHVTATIPRRGDLARLMRAPGALAAVPVPPSLVELARRRAEVAA